MIEAQELSRRYGDFTAVEGISFTVEEGEIVGMLGPNGAGKTTTIRMVTGFLPPTAGRVTVGGRDLFSEPQRVRREIGYLPEQVSLYPEMRVSEYLAYRARLEGLSRAGERRAIPDALERCLLGDVENQVIGTLSKGYRQRVGLATAILHRPKVLVLDEPTVGLDPRQIIAIRELIRELGRERTLLLSTHILPEVELLCDRVVIIDRGRIVAQGTPHGLREKWLGNTVLRVGVKGSPVGAAEALAGIAGVVGVHPDAAASREEQTVWAVECGPAADPREAIFHAAVEKGWVLLQLTEQQASLEDVFVRLTTHDAAGEENGSPEAATGSADAASPNEPSPNEAGSEEVPS